MRLNQWQQQAGLLKSAQDLFSKNETLKAILEVAIDESPVNESAAFSQTEPEHSRRLGFIEGYHHCLRVIRLTGIIPQKVKQIEPTFEPPKD